MSFAWKREGRARSSRRALLPARRAGSQWQITPVGQVSIEDPGPRLQLNAARCRLYPAQAFEGRWDYSFERELHAPPGVRLQRYLEEISGLPDGRALREGADAEEPPPIQLALQLGQPTRYKVLGGAFRTLGHAQRALGASAAPFASVALLNRYYSERAELSVLQLGHLASDAFGSATGLERPVPLERDVAGGSVVLRATGCAPRTLLRVYFRLEGTSGSRR